MFNKPVFSSDPRTTASSAAEKGRPVVGFSSSHTSKEYSVGIPLFQSRTGDKGFGASYTNTSQTSGPRTHGFGIGFNYKF